MWKKGRWNWKHIVYTGRSIQTFGTFEPSHWRHAIVKRFPTPILHCSMLLNILILWKNGGWSFNNKYGLLHLIRALKSVPPSWWLLTQRGVAIVEFQLDTLLLCISGLGSSCVWQLQSTSLHLYTFGEGMWPFNMAKGSTFEKKDSFGFRVGVRNSTVFLVFSLGEKLVLSFADH